MRRKDKVEGEGSYSASKDYNERTRKFVDSGKVNEAARKAERIGKQHAKGEDPALRDPNKMPKDDAGA